MVQVHGGNQYGLHEILGWVIRRRFGNKLVFEKKEIYEGSSRQDQGSDLLASIAATQLC